METYKRLVVKRNKIFEAMQRYQEAIVCLPLQGYSLKEEQELREHYDQKRGELSDMLCDIESQLLR